MNRPTPPGSALALLLLLLVGTAAWAQPPAPGRLGPFGIGSCYTNNRTVADNDRWMPQVAALGVDTFRTPHADWGALEPARGRWDWSAFDAQRGNLDRLGLRYGCLLIGNPSWNKLDPPGSLPVNNLEGWSNYVTEVAKRVKGRVTHLEIWNEPPNFTGKDQTAADYSKIVVAAARAARAVDPSFRIGLAAKSAHVSYLEQTIRAGAKGHYDFIVLHPYEIKVDIRTPLSGLVFYSTFAVAWHGLRQRQKEVHNEDQQSAVVSEVAGRLVCPDRRQAGSACQGQGQPGGGETGLVVAHERRQR